MKTKEEFIGQLIENRKMDSFESTALYEEAVNGLFDKNDQNSIYSLINGFYDKTENHEVMYSTLHAVEFFSKSLGLKDYIVIILPLLKNMLIDANDWAETIFIRLLNSKPAFEILKDYIGNLQKNDKTVIKKITEKLIERNFEKFGQNGIVILNNLKD